MSEPSAATHDARREQVRTITVRYSWGLEVGGWYVIDMNERGVFASRPGWSTGFFYWDEIVDGRPAHAAGGDVRV